MSKIEFCENVLCNRCGKSFDMWDRQENFGFDYHIGYGSRYDMAYVKANLCCDCFDEMLDDMIKTFVMTPVIGEYH